ncbi:unnamed protein product, partial [Choristocarpus tenellus]
MGKVQEPIKVRIIHDLSCQQESWSPSVNEEKDFEDAPSVHCGTVLGDVMKRIVDLRKEFPKARIMICKIGVKDAFRQEPI